MIEKEQLQKIAKLHNLKPWQQEKHYLQSLILITLSEEPIVFKGGTYLWFFHNLNRFSEDLDFTLTEKTSEDLPKKVSEDLGLFGIENKVKVIDGNETSTSFRISAKGPLNTGEIDMCHVYVEISLREQIIEKPITLEFNYPAYNLPTKIIAGMNLKEVVAEKVRAILTRDKPRDVYDLWFLLNKGIKLEENIVNKKLEYYNKTFDKKEFAKKVVKTKAGFEKELKALIFEKLPDFKTISKNILAALK